MGWTATLLLPIAGLGVALVQGLPPTPALVVGLALFGFVFAVDSALHSFLIVAYAESETVALHVGFYCMANAGGRLAGSSLGRSVSDRRRGAHEFSRASGGRGALCRDLGSALRAMFIYTPPVPPSSKAQELAQALAHQVRDRHARDPSLRFQEVEQAFALAADRVFSDFGASRRKAQVLAAAAAVIAMLLGGLVAFFAVQP